MSYQNPTIWLSLNLKILT
ncbi:unnamed protein product [Oppiella nova]|uniref:Uncharacterized protein n=1 Tax=Oppiella nova TaxID=334625 RepID=A0A7R9QZ83_9ACAR|nr:unnamed protein product [Oppiella nova]CAD7663968.1 unnamed protein product [Oppiella nova]CAG2181090.1 unnamed protein product [Oppiella nova]CAG2181105.1 unnamed protein product [Oppiella nova]